MKTFASEDLIKQHLDKFLVEKDGKFYEWYIMKLPGRWQKVIEQNISLINVHYVY